VNARVLVADDHTIVRQGLCSVLRGCAGIEVVGEASTGREAVERALRTRPDVVLMDARMPDMGGAEATRRILGRRPGTRVIAMSAYSEKGIVRQMLDAGACCYLLKDCDVGEFEECDRLGLGRRNLPESRGGARGHGGPGRPPTQGGDVAHPPWRTVRGRPQTDRLRRGRHDVEGHRRGTWHFAAGSKQAAHRFDAKARGHKYRGTGGTGRAKETSPWAEDDITVVRTHLHRHSLPSCLTTVMRGP